MCWCADSSSSGKAEDNRKIILQKTVYDFHRRFFYLEFYKLSNLFLIAFIESINPSEPAPFL